MISLRLLMLRIWKKYFLCRNLSAKMCLQHGTLNIFHIFTKLVNLLPNVNATKLYNVQAI
jgi:hypothetical protein